jgi:hypothetical protein
VEEMEWIKQQKNISTKPLKNKLKNLRWYSSFIIFDKNFLMLEELAKNHDKWLRMAMSICGNRDKANDLTQDMYLNYTTAPKI